MSIASRLWYQCRFDILRSSAPRSVRVRNWYYPHPTRIDPVL